MSLVAGRTFAALQKLDDAMKDAFKVSDLKEAEMTKGKETAKKVQLLKPRRIFSVFTLKKSLNK